MTPKVVLYFLLLISAYLCNGQNMQIMYDFDDLPQGLMLNPGQDIDHNKHFGIPLFSNIYFQYGASNKEVNYNNIIAGTDNSNDVLRNLYDQDPSGNDIYTFNQQIELFTIGFRMRNPKFYLSFGMYQEASGFGKYPSDIADLYFNGNDQNRDGIPEVGDPFRLSQLTGVAELLGVWHIGMNKKVNENFSFGGRFKLYSGAINVQSTSNEGVYSLEEIPFGYLHDFRGMGLGINTSGLLNPDATSNLGDTNEVIADLLLAGGNYGFGFDFGFSFENQNDLTFTGSLRDIGFVNYAGKVTTYEIKEDFQIEDVPFFPPEGSEDNYWEDLWTDYYDQGLLEDKLDTLTTSYIQLRPVKLNASVKKTKYRKTNNKKLAFRNVSCDEDYAGDILESSYGVQLYSEFRPTTTLWAVTGFYSREFSKYLNAKFTYTVDQYSFYNIGLGLSARINQFNLFIAVDNLVALPQIRDSNYQSFQLGMSVIIN